jgi:hypothetical protein
VLYLWAAPFALLQAGRLLIHAADGGIAWHYGQAPATHPLIFFR